MRQKWLIAEAGTSSEDNLAICANEGCCGFYHGIPPFLTQIAQDEMWSLPHFWFEEIQEELNVTTAI